MGLRRLEQIVSILNSSPDLLFEELLRANVNRSTPLTQEDLGGAVVLPDKDFPSHYSTRHSLPPLSPLVILADSSLELLARKVGFGHVEGFILPDSVFSGSSLGLEYCGISFQKASDIANAGRGIIYNDFSQYSREFSSLGQQPPLESSQDQSDGIGYLLIREIVSLFSHSSISEKQMVGILRNRFHSLRPKRKREYRHGYVQEWDNQHREIANLLPDVVTAVYSLAENLPGHQITPILIGLASPFVEEAGSSSIRSLLSFGALVREDQIYATQIESILCAKGYRVQAAASAGTSRFVAVESTLAI